MPATSSTSKMDITKRHSNSRVPRTAAEHDLPAHSVPVQTIKLEMLIARMQPSVALRVRELLDMFNRPKGPLAQTSVASKLLTPVDAELLVRDRIARRVALADEIRTPTRGTLIVFSVVELEKQRRRIIHWSKDHNNAAYENGYVPQVPLGHISKYLDAANAECGGVLDLRCAFWQIALAENAYAYYRFQDADGHLYEMTRVMMGHVAACELTQIVTSAIAGDPAVVQHQHVAAARVHVWIDGIRFYGTDRQVRASLAAARGVAEKCRATFKDPDYSPAKRYQFIGMSVDHVAHTNRIADKTRNQLPEPTPGQLSAREVERLVGRLLFAAGVTQDPIAKYYWVLKWARRVCNNVNRGLWPEDFLVSVSPSMRRDINRWRAVATAAHAPRLVAADARAATLFVDATLSMYGAVLVLPTQQVLISGDYFDDGLESHINVRESQAALYGLQDFKRALVEQEIRIVNLVIDNTSAEHAINRNTSTSAQIAAVVARVAEAALELDIDVRARRIKSADNPADEPSRGVAVSHAKLQAALAKRLPMYQRQGAGRPVFEEY